MAPPRTPEQLAAATEDWEAITRPARHLSADDDDPWWRRVGSALGRLDDVVFGTDATPLLDLVCLTLIIGGIGLTLAAWLVR